VAIVSSFDCCSGLTLLFGGGSGATIKADDWDEGDCGEGGNEDEGVVEGDNEDCEDGESGNEVEVDQDGLADEVGKTVNTGVTDSSPMQSAGIRLAQA